MAEIDPVILKLIADNGQYLSTLQNTTTRVDKLLGTQEKRVQQLEGQMKRSSAAIGTSLRAIAGSLSTYVGGREIVGLLDNFTRLQNSLKVAGLEGDKLKQVQDALFASAQRNGVAVNTLADLYGKAAAAQKEIGASQSQLIKLTDLTAKSLLITGTSTEQASGAILGLGQALGNAKLQAEEFNQINEGGLRPLLQAAAAGEKYGGSVSKLREAVVKGKVSNKEFFDLILKGAQDIEQKAAKATLTLSAGFNTLTNALTIYFGEADKANGVSAALGTAMGKLADNLDSLIPALATVVAFIGVRYVGSLAAAAVAQGVKTAADVRGTLAAAAYAAELTRVNGLMVAQGPLAARAAAGVSSLAVAQGVATRAAGGLTAMLGGPYGVALLAVGAALYYVKTQTYDAAQADGVHAKALTAAGQATDKAASAAEKLAGAHGKARTEALAAARAEAEYIKQKLASARASALVAQAELFRARAAAEAVSTSPSNAAVAGGSDPIANIGGAFGSGVITQNALRKAEANLNAGLDTVKKLEDGLSKINDAIDGAGKPAVSGGGDGDGKKKGKGASGRSAAEITRAFNDELASLVSQTNSAYSSIARSAEEQAELELRNVELARIRAQDGIKADKDYNAAQKKQLGEQLEYLAEAERARIEFDKRRRLEQEAQQIADAQYNSARDLLQQQYDLTDSTKERKRLALALVDAQEAHLRKTLEAVRDSATASDADKRAAAIDLERLGLLANGRREQTTRDHQSAGQKYLRELNAEATNLGDAYEDIAVRGLERMNDALNDSIKSALGLHGALGDIISDFIELALRQQILGPLANALFGGASLFGGGGGLSPVNYGAITNAANTVKIPGFATGTNFAPGGLAMVGERGRELVNLPRGSQVIPNSRLNLGGGVQQNITIKVDAQGALLAGQVQAMVQQGVQQATVMGSQIGAGQAEARMSSRARRRIPG